MIIDVLEMAGSVPDTPKLLCLRRYFDRRYVFLAESIVSEKVFFRKRYFVLDLGGIMTGNPFRQLATTNCSKNVQCPYLCRDSGLLDLNLPDFLAEVVQFPT